MFALLEAADAIALLSIVVKTLAYAATLTAAGGALAASALTRLDGEGRAALGRVTAVSALAAAVLSALRLPIRSSFLMGGSLDGAADPMMLEFVVGSPLGASIGLRLIGLLLVLAILFRGRIASVIAIVGALLIATSFALRGHALGEPRLVLGALTTLHIFGLSFWIGALQPLCRAARRSEPAAAGVLAEEFGRKALYIVSALAIAGAALLTLPGGASLSGLATPYGEGFALKLTLFTGVLCFAALNKLRLTPALLSAESGAAAWLRRSILIETLLILGVLTATAAVTTLTAAPRAEAAASAQNATALRSGLPAGASTVLTNSEAIS